MRKFSGKPANEKLFETEVYTCSVKNLTLSYSEMIEERERSLSRIEEVGENVRIDLVRVSHWRFCIPAFSRKLNILLGSPRFCGVLPNIQSDGNMAQHLFFSSVA